MNLQVLTCYTQKTEKLHLDFEYQISPMLNLQREVYAKFPPL